MPLIRRDPAASTPSKEERDPLSALLEGTNDQRWAAARAAIDARGGVQALGQALLTETDPRVREAIFTSLSRRGDSESLEAILPHLRSDDASLRTGALDALRAMPSAVASYLPSLLGDADPDVRLLACEILRGQSSKEATSLLCALLEREDQVNVCASAVEVLTEIGGPDALPALTRCADRFHSEPFLVFSIKAASARISAGEPRG